MNEGVVFSCGSATVVQIADHLAECDTRFVPRLTTRVDVTDYAAKIAQCAQRFEAWSNCRLVGLVAVYMNDALRREAFITSVSVLQECAGHGIATQLLEDCLVAARRQKFLRVVLDVAPENGPAIKLYERCGFTKMETHGASTARMAVELERTG